MPSTALPEIAYSTGSIATPLPRRIKRRSAIVRPPGAAQRSGFLCGVALAQERVDSSPITPNDPDPVIAVAAMAPEGDFRPGARRIVPGPRPEPGPARGIPEAPPYRMSPVAGYA